MAATLPAAESQVACAESSDPVDEDAIHDAVEYAVVVGQLAATLAAFARVTAQRNA